MPNTHIHYCTYSNTDERTTYSGSAVRSDASDEYAEYEMDLEVNAMDPDDRPDGVEGSDGEGSASNS